MKVARRSFSLATKSQCINAADILPAAKFCVLRSELSVANTIKNTWLLLTNAEYGIRIEHKCRRMIMIQSYGKKNFFFWRNKFETMRDISCSNIKLTRIYGKRHKF